MVGFLETTVTDCNANHVRELTCRDPSLNLCANTMKVCNPSPSLCHIRW